jgi:hypothetical protein
MGTGMYPDLESKDLHQAMQFAIAHIDGTIAPFLNAA